MQLRAFLALELLRASGSPKFPTSFTSQGWGRTRAPGIAGTHSKASLAGVFPMLFLGSFPWKMPSDMLASPCRSATWQKALFASWYIMHVSSNQATQQLPKEKHAPYCKVKYFIILSGIMWTSYCWLLSNILGHHRVYHLALDLMCVPNLDRGREEISC